MKGYAGAGGGGRRGGRNGGSGGDEGAQGGGEPVRLVEVREVPGALEQLHPAAGESPRWPRRRARPGSSGPGCPRRSACGISTAIGRWSCAVTVWPPGSITERTVARNARRASTSCRPVNPRQPSRRSGPARQPSRETARPAASARPRTQRDATSGSTHSAPGRWPSAAAGSPTGRARRWRPAPAAAPAPGTGSRTASRPRRRASDPPTSPGRRRAGRAGRARWRRARPASSRRAASPTHRGRTGPARSPGGRCPASRRGAASSGASPAGRG